MTTDYAQLAKRISTITTNCLLTALVLVAGLGFGRQVLRWWAADTPGSAALSGGDKHSDGLGDPRRLHVVQFGERPWSLRRQSIAGDRHTAASALREVCREVLREDRLPRRWPAEAQRDLLSRLARRDPAEEEPGNWRLYELDEAFPMVVGTQPQAAEAGSSQDENLAGSTHRVVVWGLALPTEPQAWNLFAFQPDAPAGERSAGLPEVPIPGECRRTLSMRVAGGGATLAFEGPQNPETWIEFYDRWSATHNWERTGHWQQFGSRWHARYVGPGEEDPPGQWQVDVHFSSEARGRSTGLMMMSPCPGGTGE